MGFGQVVIGPPGSGKTTYCNGMQHFLDLMKRKTIVINLDPANDVLPYECAINLADLISLEEVMEELDLGPNGGLVYCLEYLENNLDWLFEKLDEYDGHYFLFDCPGQAELYTHHRSIRNILARIQDRGHRLSVVHLVDAHHCTDASKFISVLLLSLSTMVLLEMPQVNVLSKIDIIEQYGELAFNLDFYTEVQDLRYLLDRLRPMEYAEDENGDDQNSIGKEEAFFDSRYRKLNEALCEIVEDFGLVGFESLNIQDASSVGKLLAVIDKSNGYAFMAPGSSTSGDSPKATDMFKMAAQESEWNYERTLGVQEKYVKGLDGTT